MKKTIFALILIFSILCTASCGIIDTPPSGDGGENGGSDETPAYTAIISDDTDVASDISSAISENLGYTLQVFDTARAEGHGEIVVGKSNRQITASAASALNTELANVTLTASYDTAVGYIIYVAGGNIAVYWNDGIVAEDATARFIAQMNDVSLHDGSVIVYTKSLRQYKIEKETAADNILYDKVSAELGDDVAAAIRNLNGLFDERMYLWFANLYDPGRLDENGNYVSGGFYYSNSARDNYGFLPDIESTWQIISFLKSSGMLEKYGGSASLALPESMKSVIVAFVKSCQSSADGYFYNPQWGSSVTNVRSGRDLNWAMNILNEFGEQPLYNTPLGDKGLLGAPSGAVSAVCATDHVTASTTSAVSKVMSASSSSLPLYLRSDQAFITYLDSLSWADPTPGSTLGSSYGQSGGVLASIATQIKASGLGDIAISYLDQKQEEIQNNLRAVGDDENGLWDPIVSYDGVNGLMKIVTLYHELGAKINYADRAIESIFTIIRMTEPDCDGDDAKYTVNIYNPWVTLTKILDNIATYGTQKDVNYYRQYVRDNAADLINVSVQKLSKFRRSDGSYGLDVDTVRYTLYGNNVAVRGSVEGDVNGALVASTNTVNSIFVALSIKDIIGKVRINMFHDSDLDAFLAMIDTLTPIDKEETVCEPVVRDFEDLPLGTENAEIEGIMPVKLDGTTLTVSADPTNGANQALLFDKIQTSTGDSFSISTDIVDSGANCSTLEFKINIVDIRQANYIFQIRLGRCYNLAIKKDGNKVAIGDLSSDSAGSAKIFNKFNYSLSTNEWYTVRVEYYAHNDDSISVKIYINEQLIAISTNHINVDAGRKPNLKFDTATFFSDGYSDISVYLDDISSEFIYKEYTIDE